jgi:ribonuclease D|tara:strand:+ start:42573 stop:43769 length:1197 start_codon:yes stop_codon:yes gene_type:complete
MTIITSSEALADFCQKLTSLPYITIDTEFLRERTYYPKLCLIQVSGPDIEAVAIDPVAAPNIDLAPLAAILKDKNIVKVMHSGRQDMEIFYKLFGFLPAPYYDTQIAAMVCGHGEQAGYEALVRGILNIQVDKSKQYTDWSIRPLSQAQITYALNDVIYLKDVYESLCAELKQEGRTKWVEEEMSAMLDTNLYDPPLDELWRKIRIKTNKPQKLAILQQLTVWREEMARKRDIPRNHVMKDDTLAEIALQAPNNVKSLTRIRGISDRLADSDKGRKILKIINQIADINSDDCPKKEAKPSLPPHLQSTLEMLKMLLRIQAADHNVAAKLIAKSDDLEAIALGRDQSLPALKGWRLEIFGEKALALKSGKIAFTLKNGNIHTFKVEQDAQQSGENSEEE